MSEIDFSLRNRVLQIETAVRTIAEWLDREHIDFDGETIKRILNGEEKLEEKSEE